MRLTHTGVRGEALGLSVAKARDESLMSQLEKLRASAVSVQGQRYHQSAEYAYLCLCEPAGRGVVMS